MSGPSLSALLGNFPTHPRCLDHSLLQLKFGSFAEKIFCFSITEENKAKLFVLKLLDFICSKWVKTK